METVGRRSRWILRALEWDDPRARWPNVWSEGMPVRVLVAEGLGSRLRLGDLIAVWSPETSKRPDRSERFVGIGRVTGLARAHDPSLVWIDLETAHRFRRPFDPGEAPRRVFQCCDPGWPAREVALFDRVAAAAIEDGWAPRADEVPAAPLPPVAEPPPAPSSNAVEPPPSPLEEIPAAPEPVEPAAPAGAPAVVPQRFPVFAGGDFSGDMRDPREGTWLAVAELRDGVLHLASLEATGRHGLESRLRDPDARLSRAEAIGLDFPFGLPVAFAEALLEGAFPEEGWWALARRLERMTRPEFLTRLHEFREAHGELKRRTDGAAGAFSPLHRVNPDLGPMTYHGIRMIAEERSRYAIRPFESARGRRLLEVYPGATSRRLRPGSPPAEGGRLASMAAALRELPSLPVDLGPHRPAALARRDALDAVLAARAAAVAVVSGEADRPPAELDAGAAREVQLEGWIFGLEG